MKRTIALFFTAIGIMVIGLIVFAIEGGKINPSNYTLCIRGNTAGKEFVYFPPNGRCPSDSFPVVTTRPQDFVCCEVR